MRLDLGETLSYFSLFLLMDLLLVGLMSGSLGLSLSCEVEVVFNLFIWFY